MKYLCGILLAIVACLAAGAVAAAQTPSPTATPTAPASATPTPALPPFTQSVPVIVEVSAQLPPGRLQPLRMTVWWTGVIDQSVSYEVERSATESTATRDFQRLATVPGNAPAANGLFSYTEPERSFALEVCYRVRAVRGSLSSAYSAEYCLPTPPRSGPGVAPSAPVTGSGLLRPTRNALPLGLVGIALMLPFIALVVAAKRRRLR